MTRPLDTHSAGRAPTPSGPRYRPQPIQERSSSIHNADRLLRQLWADRFAELPPEAREALAVALTDLRRDARNRAELQWRRNKAPMAFYWRIVSTYAGHLARALRANPPPRHRAPPS